MFEIFDQQESFKLDMIDLSCGVIRISIKCFSCLEIFDQQGNPNLNFPCVDSLSYQGVFLSLPRGFLQAPFFKGWVSKKKNYDGLNVIDTGQGDLLRKHHRESH